MTHEEKLANKRDWYKRNRQHAIEYQKNYIAARPEKKKLWDKNHKSRKRAVLSEYSKNYITNTPGYKEKMAARYIELNNISREKAENHRQIWTKKECDIVLSGQYTLPECATMLGRTRAAILAKRVQLNKIIPNIEKLDKELNK